MYVSIRLALFIIRILHPLRNPLRRSHIQTFMNRDDFTISDDIPCTSHSINLWLHFFKLDNDEDALDVGNNDNNGYTQQLGWHGYTL